MFTTGEMVVYGGEGVCRVEKIGTPELSGINKETQYYFLSPVYRNGQVLTPVTTRVLMRPVMSRSEAESFIAALPDLPPDEGVEGGQRLAKEHFHDIVTSYDCSRMAQLIKGVCRKRRWALEHSKKVSQLEERYLRRAEEQLYGELAAALCIEHDVVCAHIQKTYPDWPE